MADIRVSRGREFSATKGTPVGMQVNVFGLAKLQAEVTGQALVPIMVEALEPALAEAKLSWPILTGASIDSMVIEVIEVLPTGARVNMQAGCHRLITDPRNKSKTDYAPFIEFNGSPSGRGQGAMTNAFYSQERQMRRTIHDGVSLLIARITRL